MENSDIFIDMLKNSNKALLDTISSFQKELQSDIKGEFKSVREDIKELDEKVQVNIISTTHDLSQIKEKISFLVDGQEKQDKLIDDIRVKQIKCSAGNNWDSMVNVIDVIHKEMKKQNEDITGIQAIDKLKRSSIGPNKKHLDLPRWIPIIIALVTAAGILGGAAAIKLARSDEANSIKTEETSSVTDNFEVDTDSDTSFYIGDLD